MLLRSPGRSSPRQYFFSGACRSSCPAAIARPSMYAAKRCSCGPGAERRDPTKQFYIRLFFYDPVVLEFFERFERHVKDCGYSYRRQDLASFHVSVKCCDITILGGISGTGKS